jgi:hypothetical protein
MSFWSADSAYYVNLDCIGYTTKKYLQYITNKVHHVNRSYIIGPVYTGIY